MIQKFFILNGKYKDGMLKYNGYIFKENKKWEFFFIYKNFKQLLYLNVNFAGMNLRIMNMFILDFQIIIIYVKNAKNFSRNGEIPKK